MKLFFFLVAFCLILLRAYFAWSGHGPNQGREGSITVENGDYLEQVKWSGKIAMSDDERTIAGIAPGGYLKFRENEARMTAEANLKGQIHYDLYDGRNKLPLNDSGRNFIAACIKKMVARGFNADGRAERIYRKGGYKALLAELPNLEMENIKSPYFDLLLKNDSLSSQELAGVILETANEVSDIDKENFLRRITPLRRKDSLVYSAWMDVVSHIHSDIQKTSLLSLSIGQDSLSRMNLDRILSITTNLDADADKITILTGLLGKSDNDSLRWSKILELANQLNADPDKQNLYIKLLAKNDISEDQWIALINSASRQNSDTDKSDLLLRIAKQMPLTENLKTAYLSAAKRINDDATYGRTVKPIQ
jgi:hypothetical protein